MLYEGVPKDRMVKLLQIVLKCIYKPADARPTMSQVVEMIHSLKEEEDRRPKTMEEILTIDIKPGWKKGTKITFPEKGNEQHNLIPADLVFIIDERPHGIFKREGNDLFYTTIISPRIAMLEMNNCQFNNYVESREGSLVRGAVETVGPFLLQCHLVGLVGAIQQVLLAHRDRPHVDPRRDLILVEHHVVGEPDVVLEHDLLVRGDAQLAQHERPRPIVAVEEDLDGERAAGEYRNFFWRLGACGGWGWRE
ncbi:uncharacterized protein A4U43_C04F11090 [Asparagus officinalis]|uniref:Chaperone DnaJ C-terminal domain-containing protein n=1 Tax=Asparagus officinalis TaxID=4686 RepID=A0A5P1EZZ7_ASPOF|nr:uncharacterized protein A4U43_C04F11090 [Asparagus officinalis]